MMTTNEVADLFGVVRSTVWQWANKGVLHYTTTLTRRHLFYEDEVYALYDKTGGDKNNVGRDESIMSISEVADLFDVSTGTIYTWADTGLIKCTIIKGKKFKKYKFNRDDVYELYRKTVGGDSGSEATIQNTEV